MEELLPYYNRELAFIRNQGAEFAEAHPKIAGRLRLSQDMAEDPHVSRLIEAFALLNARTRLKLEDEYPEIAQSLLEVLYPHLLTPVPSAFIAQLSLDKSQAQVTEAQHVATGSSIETEPIEGQPCRFRTCYPLDLWPLRVSLASYHGVPLPAPRTVHTPTSSSVLRIQLETLSSKLSLAELPLRRLRFFLHGQSLHTYDLYELLLNDVKGVFVAGSDDEEPNPLPTGCIEPVGFGRNEGLLKYSARSFLGYRLLTEFFAFPEKFLFFDLTGFSPQILESFEGKSKLDLYFFLDRHNQDLEHNVEADTFRLGCTPVVNLFKQRAEPIRLTQYGSDYRIIADARRQNAHEVYSIDRVVATSPSDEKIEFQAFYNVQHASKESGPPAYWHAVRRPAAASREGVDHGSEVYLSLVDLGWNLAEMGDWTLDVDTTCINRDLPGRLPFGGGQPKLQLVDGGAITQVACLTPPTKTLRPALGKGAQWRLISHLALNQISLVNSEEGAAPLREILRIYDFAESAQSRSMIDGLREAGHERIVARAGNTTASGFCRGVEVTLHFDEDRFTGGGLFLFATVLERFLALHCNINSFTRTRITTNKREGAMRVWPPRAGEKMLA